MNAEGTVAEVLAGAAKWSTLVGDVRGTLRTVPNGSAQTCVTSPPYFGLRDYGTASWVGGDPACDHRKVADAAAAIATSTLGGGKKTTVHQQEGFRAACGRCGALRDDAQIGQERSPAEYVAAMVAVMREVRRVLADDGTLFLNLGDSYAQSGAHGSAKPKDLHGIPWAVAFALRDDGWYLRADIVWSKPNPLPESVTDRPTRAHEYVFLLTKRARYFYDADAIRERASSDFGRGATGRGSQGSALAVGCNGRQPQQDHSGWMGGDGETRNARDVWTITPEPFAEAHFATMPPELARRCILAGSRKGDVVLDPFGGAATTALVALQHGRRALLCELNPEYVEIQRRRLADFAADASSPVRVEAPEWGALFDAATKP